MYLYFVLWPAGCSIREISLEVVVPYTRCYRFIRTVIEKISSSSSYAKLDGKIEGDEFYIKAGLKGRSYHDEIIRSAGRKPRKRGLKPWRGRGTFYKDHPMITCIHQRRNGITYFDVPLRQSLLEILSVEELNMVPQYLQMNIGHMTNWKNMDSYTEV